ncbi:hypothetical protein DITRI_Ditri05aG0151400 [Diplodiscus trichospermus]
MEDWSPQDAMKAYLQTLHLVSKVQCLNTDDKQPKVIEPKCMEFISALAAGKGAKSMVQITTEGVTPLTISLGLAAKQTGGQLICIVASEPDEHSHSVKTKMAEYHQDIVDLGDVVKLVHAAGKSPRDMMMQLQLIKNIDFAVIDSKFDDNCLKLMFKKVEANIIPTGSTVIVLQHRKAAAGSSSVCSSFAQLVKKRRSGVEAVTLPIGQGIELTKILGSTIRRHKRFHVTFHNY